MGWKGGEVVKDKYITKYREMLNGVRTDEEFEEVLNRIYENGFEDGVNSENKEVKLLKRLLSKIYDAISKVIA